MKFEKRSGRRSGDTLLCSGGNALHREKPVVIYIMILFIVAFLLMALSFLMHQRSNSEVIGGASGLRHCHAGGTGHAGRPAGPAKPAG